MKTHQATETLTIEQAKRRLESSKLWAKNVLGRLRFLLPERKLEILEVGSAQGRALIGLVEEGHEVYGVEPYLPAIAIAMELTREIGVEVDIRQGRAENIPFESGKFDLVLAFAVMEHVEDLDMALGEIFRVLKPGGVFWFSSASSMCPIQNEIKGFPLFGWYPDKIKKRIMYWAMENRPELIGCTQHPAINWWTPQKAEKSLKNKGFVKVWDRWDLGEPSEDKKIKQKIIRIISNKKSISLLCDIILPGCSYATQKGKKEI